MIFVSIIEVDDDIRKGLEILINGTAGYSCIGSYRDSESAVSEVLQNPPDVLLMNIVENGISDFGGIRKIKELLPQLNIIILTVHGELEFVIKAFNSGACGYLINDMSPTQILDAIKEAYHGGAPMSYRIARMVVDSFKRDSDIQLTRRETDVLTHLCKGKSYRKIADSLSLCEGTVRQHLNHIYKKLNVKSKSEAVMKALKQRLIHS